MDLQTLFNMVYLGLKSQGFRQAMNPDTGKCVYRAPDGLKCAIGHCIPDNEYHPSMEGNEIRDALEIQELFPEIFLDDLEDLQQAHDWGDTPEEQKHLLGFFAKRNGLTIPEA